MESRTTRLSPCNCFGQRASLKGAWSFQLAGRRRRDHKGTAQRINPPQMLLFRVHQRLSWSAFEVSCGTTPPATPTSVIHNRDPCAHTCGIIPHPQGGSRARGLAQLPHVDDFAGKPLAVPSPQANSSHSKPREISWQSPLSQFSRLLSPIRSLCRAH